MKSKSYQRQQYKLNGKACSKKLHKVVYNTKGLENSTEMVALRLVNKASPYSSSIVNNLSRKTRTMKAVEDKGKKQRMYFAARKNVGARACSQKILSEDARYTDLKMPNERIVTMYDAAESSEGNDSDNDVCSVGSCSLNYWGQKEFSRDFTKYPSRLRSDSLFSDAESRCCSYDKEDICYEIEKVNVEGEIRRLL